MTPGGIVDAHLHLWDLASFRYPWLADADSAPLRHDYLVEDWRRDADGVPVAATVHVQAELDHSVDPARETAWLADLAAANGTGGAAVPTVCVGYADLRAPDLDDVLDRHQRYPLFRGIRQQAWYDPESVRADVPRDNLLDDERWVAGLDRLAARGLTFDLQVWPRQLARAADVFACRPDLTVVVEHTGLPGDTDDRAGWRAGLAEFARRVPRSVLKISGLRFVSPGWDVHAMAPVVHEAIDVFGPDRCMFGSNFPVDRLSTGYRALWQTYEAMVGGYSAPERAQLLRETAARVYRTGGTEARGRGR
ncbi:MAG TPA: amidohydrolase family protein [Actinocatenispora sp.]